MKKRLSYIIMCLLIPSVVLGGAMIFKNRWFAWVTLCVSVLACVPFFMSFEKGKANAKTLIMIAVITALSVVGRIIFSPIPGFKPVTAIVLLAGVYFGSEAGFVTGALTAVISNFYFGQGPWTSFQMFVWGFIGFLAGLFASRLKKSKLLLILFGAFSGVLFSLLMDIWSAIWADGRFNLSRYFAAVSSSVPFTVTYVVSNVVFLLIMVVPADKIFNRIKTKYDI